MNTNNGWLDIASAPKDGSRVLLWNRHFDAPCSGQFYGFGDWRMDGNLPPFVYQPTHWMPLPAAPGSPASTQTTERDWELSCDHCNGSGYVFVERQVAERKSDVQEFKEDCEECEGRGFTIAFQDIPGIAEYVKSCRPASTVADEGAKDETPAAWLLTNTRLGKTWASIVSPVPGEIEALGNGGITAEPLYRRPALAAGDARAVAALAELVACDNIKKQIASMQVCVLETDDDVRELDALMSDLARRQPAAWDAARSALAASQQGGE